MLSVTFGHSMGVCLVYLLDNLTMGMCLVKLLNTLTLVVCLVYLLDTLWECVRCNFWTLFESVFSEICGHYGSVFGETFGHFMGVCLAWLPNTPWECACWDFWTLWECLVRLLDLLVPPCSCWWTSPSETAGSSAKPLSAHPVPSGKSGSGRGKAGDSTGIYYRETEENNSVSKGVSIK